ncbi:MAG: MOSC domain-containing protein [Marichromatium sp.]|nr:MOSC domain-containing protein [Marichromatium sp.]
MNKKLLGSVVGLFVSKVGMENREAKATLTVELTGVCEDKFKGKDTLRSVLLVSFKSYEIAKQNGIDIEIGDLGENILVDFDPYSLESGTRLQVGSTTLEISQKSSLCSSLTKINNKLPKLLKDKRGIFAKVIREGFIGEGDSVAQIT